MLHGRLAALQQRHSDMVSEVRGRGLMAGIQVPDVPTRDMVAHMIEGGFCPAVAGDMVVRMLPPLDESHIGEAIGHLDATLTAFRDKKAS